MWKIISFLLAVYSVFSINNSMKDKYNVCVVGRGQYQCIPVLLSSVDADKSLALLSPKVAGRSDVHVIKMLVSSSKAVEGQF